MSLTGQHCAAHLQAGTEQLQALPGIKPLLLDEGWQAIARRPTTTPGATTKPSNLAYYLFTSGSTGQPKGASATLCGARLGMERHL